MLNKKHIIEIDRNNQNFKRLNEEKDDEKEPKMLKVRNTDDLVYTIHYLLNMLEKSMIYDELIDFEKIYKLAKD
jgi:hypothetical protein